MNIMIRNFLFKKYNAWQIFKSDIKFGHLSPGQSTRLAQNYEYYEKD